ncbi:MAG: hypothetical protein IPP51_06270 [Bacteroidetes bacterium]|nr:hypothetical protein [Bacteroidota bacterium]
MKSVQLFLFTLTAILTCLFSNAQSWEALGPLKPGIITKSEYTAKRANGIGRVSSVRFDDFDTSKIFCGSPYGALYSSSDAGKSWKVLKHESGVADYVINPKNRKIRYLVTGDPDCILNPNEPALGSESCQSSGILKSTDGGKSWTSVSIGIWYDVNRNAIPDFWKFPTKNVIRRLIIHPKNGSLYAVLHTFNNKTKSFDGFIYRSTDGGKTWFVSLSAPCGFLRDLEMNPKNPKILYTAGSKIFKSEDGGVTWIQIMNDVFPTDSLITRIEVACSPVHSSWLYVLFVSPSQKKNIIYFSADNGLSFRKTGVFNMSPEWRTCLAINPGNDKQICFTSANTVIYAERIDTSFKIFYNSTAMHDDVHEIVFQKGANKLFVGTDGGLYYSTPGENLWNYCSSGQNIAECWGVAVAQKGEAVVLAGLQDCGTILYRPDSSGKFEWYQVRGGDGMKPAFDPSNSNICYANDGNNNLIARSDSGGVKWNANISTYKPQGAYLRPFVVDPVNPATIYTGYHQLYRSSDRGAHWDTLPLPSPDVFGSIIAIAIAPSDNRFIYIAYENPCWSETTLNRLFMSQDGGSTWKDISPGLTGVKYSSISSLAVDPLNQYHVAVGFHGGWAIKTMSSEAAGLNSSWVDNSAGLPVECDVYCLIFDRSNPMHLFAGTLKGVWQLKANTVAWEKNRRQSA